MATPFVENILALVLYVQQLRPAAVFMIGIVQSVCLSDICISFFTITIGLDKQTDIRTDKKSFAISGIHIHSGGGLANNNETTHYNMSNNN